MRTVYDALGQADRAIGDIELPDAFVCTHLIQSVAAVASAASAAVVQPKPEVFDYIVVGGGTAGLTVATRLSLGLPDAKVLVIEAGGDGSDAEEIYVPGMRGRALGGRFDWNLTTIPQPGLLDRSVIQPRGKVLGGSSALNFLTHNRAAEAEYDDWETLGNPGWNWDTMLAAMVKAENFTGFNSQYYGSEGAGNSGPLQTVMNRVIPYHQNAWIPTLNNLGVETNRESLGGDVNGVMYQPSTIDPKTWVRSYSANAYLPIAGPNLKVWANTRVAKVNFRAVGQQQRATGVTLADGRTVTARKEVILSAGALQSPGLLELSGIGRADVLKTVGIKQIIDSPGVGENLQDHVRAQVSFQLRDNLTSADILVFNQTFAAEQMELYHEGKVSMWDYTNSAYAFTNWRQAIGRLGDLAIKRLARGAGDGSPAHRANLRWLNNPSIPQLELIFQDGYIGDKGYPPAGSPLFGKSFFTLVNCLMHPFSRGSVHIASKNIADKPIINPNYLSHEHDVEALVNIIKYARKVAKTEPLRSFWVAEYEPGVNTATDKQLRDYVRKTTSPIYHPSGTAALLPKKDGGVVDTRLKVYGTQNLRVIDASIIPVLVSAHITTAVYGIAERGAELVIEDAT
ncbi:GMC oxidoreductase family protein [Paramyrothecium foliicola]|nr:GMC oxidoreductase family protein [Paramyrothecium foliicola]